MSATIYPSATDHVNKNPYTVYVPPHVFNIHRQVLERELFAPPYEAFDAKQPQKARVTIAEMVSYVISNTTFTIADDYDVLVILHQIDAYVEEVFPLRGNKSVSSYIERILKLRSRIYTLFLRVLNKRPQWRSVYDRRQDIFAFILELYRPLGFEVDVPQGAIEELALCPTVRANPDYFIGLLRPVAQQQASGPSDIRPTYSV